jgi:hypothetical protein
MLQRIQLLAWKYSAHTGNPMMRSIAGPLALLLMTPFLSAQQPVNPGASRVPSDAATFGNKKPSKKEKAPTTRTVSGQVTDETGQVLEGALVTLTDSKTKEKTSFFTKKDGRYQFEDLSFNNDYELQARYKDKSSEPRKLSQFDHTPRPVRILEINTESNPAAAANAKRQ